MLRDSSRVRELVKKIENHRQSLQRNLQQNKAYNPFSTTSKKMTQDVGNVELFELFETDPKTQCKECLSYWSEGSVYCTCGHLLKEACIKKHFKGIHHRFLKDREFRASQLEHDRDEEVCIKMDDLADKDFSHYMTESEYFRYKQNWWISLNKSGNTGLLRNRSDFNEALSTLNRLHQ